MPLACCRMLCAWPRNDDRLGTKMTGESKQYQEAEKRLREWGTACRDTAQALGIPTISSLSETIAHIQQKTRKEKTDRRRAIRKERDRRNRLSLPPLDAKLIAEMFGFVDQDETAKGKTSRGGNIPTEILESRLLEIDSIISRLPRWARKCVFRSYMYGQPDRVAAFDMKMHPGDYCQRRKASVHMVATRLDQRYIRRDSGRRPCGIA